MKTRAALTLLALLAMFGVAVSQPSGPVLRGTVAANGTAGNLTYVYSQPSPGVSPVSAGKLDVATTDGTGVLWTRIVSAANLTLANLLTADLDTNGGANVTTGAIMGIAVPGAGGAVQVGGSANGLLVRGTKVIDSSGATGPGVLISSTNATNYQSFSLQLAGTWSGTVQVDGSNDGSTWVNLLAQKVNADATELPKASFTANGIYAGPVPTNYVRVNVSAYTSGTILGYLSLSPLVLDPQARGAAVMQGAAANGATASGNPVQVGGVYRATPSTLTDGQVGSAWMTSRGMLGVVPYSPSGGAVTDSGGLYVQANDTAQAVGHDTVFEAQCAGGTAESTAKASAGLLKWIHVSNPNTSDVFLQIFNASNPTPGSTTPTMIFTIPGGTGASNRGIYNQEFGPVGVTFSTAITYTITTTATGSTAPAANCTTGFGYK